MNRRDRLTRAQWLACVPLSVALPPADPPKRTHPPAGRRWSRRRANRPHPSPDTGAKPAGDRCAERAERELAAKPVAIKDRKGPEEREK